MKLRLWYLSWGSMPETRQNLPHRPNSCLMTFLVLAQTWSLQTLTPRRGWSTWSRMPMLMLLQTLLKIWSACTPKQFFPWRIVMSLEMIRPLWIRKLKLHWGIGPEIMIAICCLQAVRLMISQCSRFSRWGTWCKFRADCTWSNAAIRKASSIIMKCFAFQNCWQVAGCTLGTEYSSRVPGLFCYRVFRCGSAKGLRVSPRKNVKTLGRQRRHLQAWTV